MAATTRTITDTIYKLDGTPWAGAILRIDRLDRPMIDADGTIGDIKAAGTTDADGAVSLTVAVPPSGAGSYRMTRPVESGKPVDVAYFYMTAGDPITVGEILAASASALPTDAVQALLNAYLSKADNLASLASAATARTNLGLGTAAVAATGDFEAAGAVAAHTDADSGAHAASAISVTPAGNLAATDVQAALEEIQGDVDGMSSDVDDLTTTTGSSPNMLRVAVAGGLEYRTTAQVLSDIGAAPTASPTFTGTVTLPTTVASVIKPASDSTTALQLANAAGTAVLTVDTTNKYINLPGTNAVIQLGGQRFAHTYASTTGGGAVSDGKNTFVGVEAGNLSVGSAATQTYHGSLNTGVGYRAMYALTNGYYNMAFGTSALRFLTTGYANVAIGANSLFTLVTGYYNVAIGDSALFYLANASTNNIAIGRQAGQSHAGGSLTTAAQCIYIGTLAKASADSVTNEIAIGDAVTGSGSNSITLGNASITSTVLRGIVNFTGTMNNSALDPTSDAPADWVEIKIGGTTYYLPAYAAS